MYCSTPLTAMAKLFGSSFLGHKHFHFGPVENQVHWHRLCLFVFMPSRKNGGDKFPI